jgi:amino acid permease
MRTPPEHPQLPRRFGLLPATALNMTNMIGVGPFITIPLLMTALGGPQAMLGWIVALVIVICDGMVWSELGAAMPGSGGSFHYLREAFGRERFGRLMACLFVWQFVLSGPLEDEWGFINIVVPSYLVEKNSEVVKFATFVVIKGRFEKDGQVMNVIGEKFKELNVRRLEHTARSFR